MGAIEAQRVEHADEVVRGVLHRERDRRAGRAAVAADVVGEHAPPARERRHDRLPHAPVQPERVDEQHRRSARAGLGDGRVVIAQRHAAQPRRPGMAGLGRDRVDDGDRVERAREAGVRGEVLAKGQELRRRGAEPQRRAHVRRQLALGPAERGDGGHGRELALEPAQLRTGQRSGEDGVDHRLVDQRRTLSQLRERFFGRGAHQRLVCARAPLAVGGRPVGSAVIHGTPPFLAGARWLPDYGDAGGVRCPRSCCTSRKSIFV